MANVGEIQHKTNETNCKMIKMIVLRNFEVLS